ncbi:hypothetical protein [Rhodococcus opacus]|uniref:hypothetical protein n=1 Tax=Rhodococcus opacus TaxID=37919 RepID=UPI002949C88D|nr:hypothetical protein [Rhodococcus opacus]MDV6244766.1 hypothetical protein [Rhodococcus opacus]
MNDVIFQASDLATKRVEFLHAARAGTARLRDKDGTSLVMLPEQTLEFLETLAAWSAHHLRLQELVSRGVPPSISDLGNLAWLRAFDAADLHEFVRELHDSLIAALADRSTDALDETVRAWQVTARELEDPLRRSILMNDHSGADYIEAERPDEQ